MFRALRTRNYRLWASGQIVSLTGTWMQRVAQDWLVLTLSGGNAVAVGIVMALQFGPTLVLSVWGGVLADRYDKRRILVVTQVAMAACGLVLAVLDLGQLVELWHVYLVALVLGCASAIDAPVRQSFTIEMVGPALLSNAIGLNSMTFNLARIIGPAISGVLITLVGTGLGVRDQHRVVRVRHRRTARDGFAATASGGAGHSGRRARSAPGSTTSGAARTCGCCSARCSWSPRSG